MFLTFGEIMLRLATPQRHRFGQCLPGAFDASFGGGESNVAVALARMGNPVAFLSALPRNPLADAAVQQLRGHGVDTSRLLRTDHGRLGIYFLETGSNQRPSVVVYDRDESSIARCGPEAYDLDRALDGVTWVHTTGITPALSRSACEATRALAAEAGRRGIPVSMDLNFRKKLWRWDASRPPRDLARACMAEILNHVTLVIANEEDCADVLDLHADHAEIEQGRLNSEAYLAVARQVTERFPRVKQVAITLRESLSADHNRWGALLFDRNSGKGYLAPLDPRGVYAPYDIRNIVDRVGGGDSFGAGLLHGLCSPRYQTPERALRFAVAASALKHTIHGDFNLVTESEVEALMNGSASGRVQR